MRRAYKVGSMHAEFEDDDKYGTMLHDDSLKKTRRHCILTRKKVPYLNCVRVDTLSVDLYLNEMQRAG